ncbi:PRC-barrel-like [Quillaja saponaria]|uniref:PRC-barrel-like n=1 Tax=Quillaja saponaria TaxID=32244 RepID=A0AAD7L3E5_QUISA|nr:PRC-barrel-like [Quillaja saponaria]
MSDSLAPTLVAISVGQTQRPFSPVFNYKPRNEPKLKLHAHLSLQLLNAHISGRTNDRNDGSLVSSGFSVGPSARAGRSWGMMGSEELGFKDKAEKNLDLRINRGDTDMVNLEMNLEKQSGNGSTQLDAVSLNGNAAVSSESDYVELNSGVGDDNPNRRGGKSVEGEDLVGILGGKDGVDLKSEEEFERFSSKVPRRSRQVMRRTSFLAKQVISIQSALSLGFISQLWVDTNSWMVLLIEVRPNLLSGESERFLLEDVSKVGDVVLVQDESVIESEFQMVGLETLVGYKVVTPGRRNIGKVRGYTFNINSGAVEALELDSFGISIIPSSLVSTYALLVEDVLEVVSDAVVVHEAAASRIQRISKGLLGNQNVGTSIDELEEYSDFERPARSDHRRRSRRSFGGQKPYPRDSDAQDDWEGPMDFL